MPATPPTLDDQRVVIGPPSGKRCPKCNVVKARSDFSSAKRSPDGLQAWCRGCAAGSLRALRDERVQTGACLRCDRPCADGLRHCVAHLAELRDKRKARSDRGDCRASGCPNPPASGHKYCSAHRDYFSAHYRARIASGRCRSCVSAAEASGYCKKHWVRMLAAKHLDSAAAAPLLEALWDQQGGRCALTGVELAPGTASVDHIVPRSRGGLNVIGNLRWLALSVNAARSDRTDDEYIAECRRVVAWADAASRRS